jgi:hypothetical protein
MLIDVPVTIGPMTAVKKVDLWRGHADTLQNKPQIKPKPPPLLDHQLRAKSAIRLVGMSTRILL